MICEVLDASDSFSRVSDAALLDLVDRLDGECQQPKRTGPITASTKESR